MGFGMIGALGGFGGGTGLGGAMMNEAALMQKDEERKQAQADQKAMEEWRLRTAEGYKIQAEQRAEQAAIRADTRAWENEKTRAPERADMAASASVKAKNADLEFNTKNRDAIAANAKAMKEAQETDAEKEERRARADYYSGRSTALVEGSGKKLDPMLKEQIDSLDKEIERKATAIDNARAKQEWASTPDQKRMEAELSALKLRREGLYARGTKEAGQPAVADPLGMRGARSPSGSAAPRAPAGKPGALIQPGDNDYQTIYTEEFEKATRHRQQAKTPEEIQRAETDLQRIQEEAKRVGVTIGRAPAAPAPRPAAAPAPSMITAGGPPAAGPTALPRSLGDIPGVNDAGRVKRGEDFGGSMEEKIAKLRAGTRGGPLPPAAPPSPDLAVRTALGASGSTEIEQIVGERAPALIQAAQAVREAQQKVVEAAKSQQEGAVQRAMSEASLAGKRLDALLKDMMPAQQRRVREALGL